MALEKPNDVSYNLTRKQLKGLMVCAAGSLPFEQAEAFVDNLLTQLDDTDSIVHRLVYHESLMS